MAASPAKYFYSVVGAEKIVETIDERKFQDDYLKKKNDNFFLKKRISGVNGVKKRYSETLGDHNDSNKGKLFTFKNKDNSPFESLKFLKKIYRPQKEESQEKLSEIKKNIIKNRILTLASERNKNKNKNFRINSERSYSNVLNSLELQNSLREETHIKNHNNSQNIEQEKLTFKENSEFPEKPKSLKRENEKIKQTTTYKMIENKIQKLSDNANKELKSNDIQPNNPINQVNVNNQPNSFNISVNLKPTIHLNLNSNIQRFFFPFDLLFEFD